MIVVSCSVRYVISVLKLGRCWQTPRERAGEEAGGAGARLIREGVVVRDIAFSSSRPCHLGADPLSVRSASPSSDLLFRFFEAPSLLAFALLLSKFQLDHATLCTRARMVSVPGFDALHPPALLLCRRMEGRPRADGISRTTVLEESSLLPPATGCSASRDGACRGARGVRASSEGSHRDARPQRLDAKHQAGHPERYKKARTGSVPPGESLLSAAPKRKLTFSANS